MRIYIYFGEEKKAYLFFVLLLIEPVWCIGLLFMGHRCAIDFKCCKKQNNTIEVGMLFYHVE